jgi:hypothetical protein
MKKAYAILGIVLVLGGIVLGRPWSRPESKPVEIVAQTAAIGLPAESHAAVPLRVASVPSEHLDLGDLKRKLSGYSDRDLEEIEANADREIRQRLRSDSSGANRDGGATEELSRVLDQKAAARILLIDRQLDAARRRFL